MKNQFIQIDNDTKLGLKLVMRKQISNEKINLMRMLFFMELDDGIANSMFVLMSRIGIEAFISNISLAHNLYLNKSFRTPIFSFLRNIFVKQKSNAHVFSFI